MPDIERIKEAFKWLKFQGYAASDKDIADTLGYTKSSFFPNHERKGSVVGEIYKQSFDCLPCFGRKLAANWWRVDAQESLPRTAQNDCPGVPYYDLDVTATITESFTDVKEDPEFFRWF